MEIDWIKEGKELNLRNRKAEFKPACKTCEFNDCTNCNEVNYPCNFELWLSDYGDDGGYYYAAHRDTYKVEYYARKHKVIEWQYQSDKLPVYV